MIRRKKPMRGGCPLEDVECEIFSRWLDLMRVRFTHVASENKAHDQRSALLLAVKRKRIGVRPGCPDFIVIIPAVGNASTMLLFVEMKRKDRKLTRVSLEQEAWIMCLRQVPGVEARVCYGADEAISFVREYLIV